ncbi:MAG: 4Fe-4S dicluster domain-containing protein [Myxococcaceae bacterium]|nr:4Fe-4S dicluster domain-containing protein [Myxococcaceae bacterium]
MADDKVISYQPTDGLTYDPEDPKYWDKRALDKEVNRVFEVCNGCRMCFKYCDTFPSLFKLLDDKYDGDVRKLSAEEKTGLMDACFQCKLCEVQCPYTPRDNHEYQLDFPKLVHRFEAVKTKEQGVPLRERVLGDPDGTAKMARASLGMANAMNRVGAHRWFLEKLLGIHRDKDLPDFAQETFSAWAEENEKIRSQPGSDAVLFQTCYVENNEPQLGRDTLEVLEKNNVKTACLKGLRCCGMPAWEHGDLDALQEQAKHNLALLMPHVDAGAKVLAINPTCSMMLRREYPELVQKEDRPAALRLAAAVQDPGEYLWQLKREGKLNTDFKSTPGDKVAYHAPCHLRAQAVGFKGRDLLRQIPGVSPSSVLECCGHDGTYAMKVETFEASKRIGERAFNGMKQAEAEVWSTECPLAATQFAQHAGVKPMHPMSILAHAYREDGFPKRIEPKPANQSEAAAPTGTESKP